MNRHILHRLLPAAALAGLAFVTLQPAQAAERYDTWVQGDTVKLTEGQTALIIFASPDCQVSMIRPGDRPVRLKIEPTAKALPMGRHWARTGGFIPQEDPALALITSPRTPIALVGPAVLTLENSTGPRRDTCYVSVMITDTHFGEPSAVVVESVK